MLGRRGAGEKVGGDGQAEDDRGVQKERTMPKVNTDEKRLFFLKFKYKPLHPWDCLVAVVVRARSAKEARKIVQKEASMDENLEHPNETPWLDPEYTSCTRLSARGKSEIILKDVLEG